MECEEILTGSGRGHWGDRSVRYALSTVRITWRARTGTGARSKERYRFTFQVDARPADLREFDTEAERSAMIARSIPDAIPWPDGAGLLQGCLPSVSALVGERLAGVWFVIDYVQLQFDDGITNFYAWPKVRRGEEEFDFGQPGYRDALCAFICERVTQADLFLDAGLVVSFGSGQLIVSPDQIRGAPQPEVVEGYAISIWAGQFPYGEEGTWADFGPPR